ncbi:hypothetical protein SAMD00019534_060230 [Acytostelium subglobosum LB1]|uniref:hypothetical protein n=1 Tax=Acytostelium subglobosum LB1 TaxID=1410327 RepID=UPI000644D1AC|nr:hypothetical protein SAMD00019534_060230 [Acytostelium subglobosum LB1]GAM22848.1 hypothetical protein SAMD00019534_060230 [Acytostelium subglobosum LB1]|eukprot:XP_012754075.1 hypothetical protein SAMD00019534_060230 [Acytostelium subglobosum LB1]
MVPNNEMVVDLDHIELEKQIKADQIQQLQQQIQIQQQIQQHQQQNPMAFMDQASSHHGGGGGVIGAVHNPLQGTQHIPRMIQPQQQQPQFNILGQSTQLRNPGVPQLHLHQQYYQNQQQSSVVDMPRQGIHTTYQPTPTPTSPIVNVTSEVHTSALANIVSIPSNIAEINVLTPITAIPTSSAAAQELIHSPYAIEVDHAPPFVPNTTETLSDSGLYSSGWRNFMEIKRPQNQPSQEIVPPTELNDMKTLVINIPSIITAQQSLLTGLDQLQNAGARLQNGENLLTKIDIADDSTTIHNYTCPDEVPASAPVKTMKGRSKRFSRDKMKKFKNSVYQILVPETTLPIHLVDSEQLEHYVVPFLMELGRALLMSGVPVHRLEYELTLISSTFGMDGHFFSTPTGIFFSFGSPHSILSPYTHLLRIQSMDYNMYRLTKLEELADEVIYAKKNCQDALVDLKDILRQPPLYNIYMTVASFLMSSFAFSFFLQSGWIEVGSISLIGLCIGLLTALSMKLPTIGKVVESIGAFGGSFLAGVINSYIYPVPRVVVTIGGIIALAPGLSITIAMAEISTRNLVSGNARLIGAFTCLLQLSFGIAMGTTFAEKVLPVRPEIMPVSFPSWTMFIAVPLAAISYAIQMKAHPNQMWIIMLTSMLGIVAGNWGNQYFGTDVGSFFGACLICIIGNLYARFTGGTSVVPIMAGIIVLVPGSMGVKGFLSVSGGNASGGLDLLTGMFMIATSLTIGLLVANLLVKPGKALQ